MLQSKYSAWCMHVPQCSSPCWPSALCLNKPPFCTAMPACCSNYTARYTSRIAGISGNEVTLERPLPWALRQEMQPALVRRTAPVTDVGLEGFTLQVRRAGRGDCAAGWRAA